MEKRGEDRRVKKPMKEKHEKRLLVSHLIEKVMLDSLLAGVMLFSSFVNEHQMYNLIPMMKSHWCKSPFYYFNRQGKRICTKY